MVRHISTLSVTEHHVTAGSYILGDFERATYGVSMNCWAFIVLTMPSGEILRIAAPALIKAKLPK